MNHPYHRPLLSRARLLLGIAVSLLILLPGLDAGSVRAQQAPVAYNENGGGGKNVVHVVNRRTESAVIRGAIQLNRIPGPDAAPLNRATAVTSCTDCESLALALQINLISRTATQITPTNVAAAVNVDCTRCLSMAWALQYVVQVDDPARVPEDVQGLITAMKREVTAVATEGLRICEAIPRLNAVITQFASLAQSLYAEHVVTEPALLTCPTG